MRGTPPLASQTAGLVSKGGFGYVRFVSPTHGFRMTDPWVPRLTVIAAKALHQALLDSLDAAAEDIRRHQEAAEARRRRREARRLAREAEEAAQQLKQGKVGPCEGPLAGPSWGG